MNQQLYQVCKNVADKLGMRTEPEPPNICNMMDSGNSLFMTVEFAETKVETWIWDCQSIVDDLTSKSPNPLSFLQLNSGGLTWCYFAVHPYEGGYSLNLKYTFATPINDPAFAEKLLFGVLSNIRNFTIKTRAML
jgi:hypothetical protein